MAKNREAKFAILVRHWIMANPFELPAACALEMKQTQVNWIPFSAVEPHQVDYAEAVESSRKGVLTRVQGVNGEPDYIYLRQQAAFIVILFPGFFCFINIRAFEQERITCGKRKSLTAARAREIAHTVVLLRS